MHQDNAFYAHATNRYVDTLIHLDDTGPENGEIRRFMELTRQATKHGYLDRLRILRDYDVSEGLAEQLDPKDLRGLGLPKVLT